MGDDPSWDVEGAKRSNLKAVLLNPDEAVLPDCVAIRDLTGVIALVGEAG